MSLYIYGYRGVALEIAELCYKNHYDIEGYIVDDLFFDSIKEDKQIMGLPIIPYRQFIQNNDGNTHVAVTFGEPSAREKLSIKLKDSGIEEVSLDFSEFCSSSAMIKNGTILHFGSYISVEAIIGYSCLINKHSLIGHNSTIGDYNVISPGVKIGGYVQTGNNVFIGIGACIRDRVKIGNNVIIGMGSVVTKDIEDNAVVVGNPAKIVRYNDTTSVFKKNHQ